MAIVPSLLCATLWTSPAAIPAAEVTAAGTTLWQLLLVLEAVVLPAPHAATVPPDLITAVWNCPAATCTQVPRLAGTMHCP